MASMLTKTITPDSVVSFQIKPGTLFQFLGTRAEGGPRLKCFEGSVTLVSPGMPHETKGCRLDLLILAVCQELGIEREALRSTTWALPFGAGDTAYEADNAYYIQSQGTAKRHQPPDLVVEVVVTHPVRKALLAGAFLGIPELWALDVPQGRLTFYHLATQGKLKGTYRPRPRSRAFPVLLSSEVMEQLDDPETGDTAFLRNCRAWAKRVLVPRVRELDGGA